MSTNIGLDAGLMRHRVTVEANTPTYDLANQPQASWSSWKVRWARIETVAGGDFIQNQQIRNLSSHVVTMRNLPGIDPKVHRIVYGIRVFNIVSVISSEERAIDSVIYVKEVL